MRVRQWVSFDCPQAINDGLQVVHRVVKLGEMFFCLLPSLALLQALRHVVVGVLRSVANFLERTVVGFKFGTHGCDGLALCFVHSIAPSKNSSIVWSLVYATPFTLNAHGERPEPVNVLAISSSGITR